MIPIDLLAFPTHANVRILCAIWVTLFAILLWHQWRSPRAFGLPLVYAFGMTLIHLPGGFAYSFDYYSPSSAYLLDTGASIQVTHPGLWMSTLGFGCFVLGSLLCPLLFSVNPPPKRQTLPPQVTSMLPGTLLLLSFAFFFVISPITKRIPSVSALGSGGIHFSVVAVFLFCHRAYHQRDLQNFRKWLVSTVGFPLVTVVFMGFMSYGIASAVAVWMLVVRFFRPRWLSLAVLGMVVYVGLTLFVNWMFYREWIRKSYVTDRIAKVQRMLDNLEVFDPYSQTHMEALDTRLNQNDFVGKTMDHTGSRNNFANGSTLWVAFTAWIPRIIWPNKPILGGSGDLVSNATNQELNEDTSFGVGQVLEFYVNFGTPSVVLGFIIFAIALTFIDQRAAHYLSQSDYWNLTRWMLPALGMIQPNGALGEVVSAAAANAILVTLLHHAFFKKFYHDEAWNRALNQHEFSIRTSNLRGSKTPRLGSKTLPNSRPLSSPPQQGIK
jgi:hypothetical protein